MKCCIIITTSMEVNFPIPFVCNATWFRGADALEIHFPAMFNVEEEAKQETGRNWDEAKLSGFMYVFLHFRPEDMLL
jgi:hypothetical protein